MLAERPRARRHVFSAHLELLDVESESRIITRTRDLTMFGFRAEIRNCSWPVGTRVRVKITHKASNFTAGARIVWVRTNTDLGVAFTDVTPRDQLILEKWIAELRGTEVLAHSDSVWQVSCSQRVSTHQNFTKYQFSKLNSKKASNRSQHVAGP